MLTIADVHEAFVIAIYGACHSWPRFLNAQMSRYIALCNHLILVDMYIICGYCAYECVSQLNFEGSGDNTQNRHVSSQNIMWPVP